MIHQLLAQAHRSPSAAFLVTHDRTLTYLEAAAEACRLGHVLRGRHLRRLAIHCHDSPELVLLLAGCAAAGCEPCVLDRGTTAGEVGGLLSRLEMPTVVADAELAVAGADVLRLDELVAEARGLPGDVPPAAPADPRLLVLTTGTTGPSKAAVYAWASLAAQVRPRHDLAGTRWLLAYHLNHFAGLQVLLHVLVNAATLVMPRSSRVADAIAAIADQRVENVSATPTFWRFLLAELGPARAADLHLGQITLGGEAVPQDLLDALHRTFPAARISQVFATTEAGSCFSVRDLEHGLPASLLERPGESGVEMRVVDGELQIRSRHGMLGYFGEGEGDDTAWRATGDLVERRGDRLHFLGRKTETINVGGVKVHPPTVEELVQRVPGVTAVRCYGKPNPVTGQIVALDVLAADATTTAALEERIRAACSGLSRHAQPRLVRFVESLDTANHKLVRRTS
jgi:acyl-CoA synthetase (AMP-forming)/AMP-acid ligase II